MYDVYDLDERKWSCWDEKRGYLCGWMSERAYLKWLYVEFGSKRQRLPGPRTIWRGQADEKEARRGKQDHGSPGAG